MGNSLYKEAKNRTQKELEKKLSNDPAFNLDNAHPYYRHHDTERRLRLLERGDFRVGGSKIPDDVAEYRAKQRGAEPMLGETHEFKMKALRAIAAKERKERRQAGDDARNKVKENIADRLSETRDRTFNQEHNSNTQQDTNHAHNDSVASHTAKPKLLSTRRRKALAAGGALAVAGLGAYAYKKHLDKKREEANAGKNS